MKYEKAQVTIVEFDNFLFMATSIAGLGTCETVNGPLSQAQVIEKAGGGHGTCGGFQYVETRTYYDCGGYARSGYNCPSNHCDVVDEQYCHVVYKA